jgi:hypothetical protein|tara:strand:- start:3644 stop:3829 length:186 start_codon:yes stop_codon:yes gene_type:complete
MKVVIFSIVSLIVGYFAVTLLKGTLGNPNFGYIGGSAAYFRLFLLLAIGFLIIYGLYNLLF